MRVRVKLFDIFCDFFPPGTKGPEFWLELQEAAKPKDIFARLKIPDNLQKSIKCNGRVAKEYQVLQDGDEVAIFSPITGG